MDYNAIDEPSQKTSRINSAQLLNLTLDLLWKDAHNHSRKRQFSEWDSDLNMIWGELAGDVDPGKTDEKTFFDLCEKIYETGSLSNPPITGFKNSKSIDVKTRSKQYILLLRKHVWLKRLQNRLGKGTAYKDQFEDEFN